MTNRRRSKYGDAVTLALWAALIAPLSIVFHELGHFTVYSLSGYPARLGPMSVSLLPNTPTPPLAIAALGQAAGPAVTVLLTLLAIIMIRRRGPQAPWVALALTAPLRMIVIFVFLGLTIYLAAIGAKPGESNFDEYNVATTLGLPVVPFLIPFAAFLLFVWIMTVRAIPRGGRWVLVTSAITGAALGAWLWAALLGPILLG